ncbi:Uncharacterised protein [Yersinia pseudotuberculosis]|uniref:Uncharacterized protein n=2 Tax=Yersinia pseudotuberculosis complex TaxID=1649845 RepID=A0A380Q813_YERPU|nr:Uncharacterised protein [Yersinia pseudotuberculosis]CNL17816.1 Uncharacterised protein [Yersinia pseudotuberculosis]CRG50480.1 Uncharacterised protein [Yersinia wautersii]SUP82463.1 Uncharacterised protein [Yersinia pseudotuberculosis]
MSKAITESLTVYTDGFIRPVHFSNNSMLEYQCVKKHYVEKHRLNYR